MAYWNIGIDESGSFTYYNAKGKRSFVCAAVTEKNASDLNREFEYFYYTMNKGNPRNTSELLSFFHAMERSESEKETIFKGMKKLISKIVLSKGRPLVLGNPQHWWVSAVMSVLRQILMLDEIKPGDVLDIYVATRSVKVVGIDGEISHKSYHEQLQKDLQYWIASINEKKVDINLVCIPAFNSSVVTLADQAVGMLWKYGPAFWHTKLQYAECGDFYEMFNMDRPDNPKGPNPGICSQLIESGDYLSSLQYWLRAFFAKESIPFEQFSDIMNGAFADGHTYTEVWRVVLDTCEYALDNRGEDPQLIDRVFKLEPKLQNEYARIQKLNSAQKSEHGIDIHLLMDIWRVLAKVASHRGDTSCDVLDVVDRFWENGNQEIGSTLDRWKFYLQTKLIGAQIPFNGYDFSSVISRMEPLLDCHEKLYNLPLPFERMSVDDELAALLGTYGQAEAFQGKLDEAISIFKEDFAYSSIDWKPMPASFLVTVHHRKSDFEQACAWFEKQTDGVTFEDFGKNLSSTSDLWQMVNYFKLLVLAQLQERPVECNIPELESWNNQNTYPWPLVLKWAALSLMLSGNVDRGLVLLEEAKKLLKKGGFAIKTLALPILQMLYCVTEDEGYEKEYRGLLQQLTDTCEAFKTYVESQGDAFKLDKDKNLWDAAMILPFNYA